MRFIIGKLTNDEFKTLKRGEPIISKMLLNPEDFRVFHYREGDEIEVETLEGNRIWTTIRNLEIVQDEESIVLIFTLVHDPSNHRN